MSKIRDRAVPLKIDIYQQGPAKLGDGPFSCILRDPLALFEVDLADKGYQVAFTGSRNGTPCVDISQDTPLAEDESPTYTTLLFPEFNEWLILLANISRYTLYVCAINV